MTKNCCNTNWDFTSRSPNLSKDVDLATFIGNLASLGKAYKKEDMVTSHVLGDLAKSMWECNLKKVYRWKDVKAGKLEQRR